MNAIFIKLLQRVGIFLAGALIATNAAQIKPITARVTYVFDGDTIEIAGGARVRYIGMNAPEIAHPENRLNVLVSKRQMKIKHWFWEKQ